MKRGTVAGPEERIRRAPEERIRRAVESWFITEPVLFGAFLAHRLRANPEVGTLRVAEGRLEYAPDFIQRLPDRTLAELLQLEAVRIVLKHPYTRRPADGTIAYQASNITLKEHLPTSLPIPTALEMFGDPSLSRQYFELYCDRLLALGNSGGMGAEGNTSTMDGSLDQGALSGDSREGKPADGSHPLVSDHLAPERGPVATQYWQEDAFAREQINDAIRDAERSNGWGSLPGSLVAQILASLRPGLDYRAVLRRFRTSILASHRELTRMRPNRRYGFDYMGSRFRLRTRLLIAVDVSGSMGRADLETAFSAVNQLFQYGIETVDVLQFDTEITAPVQTLRKKRFEVTVQGRGGTLFDPVLTYIDEHTDYDGLIIITDGAAPRPHVPHNRRTRVLWLFHDEETYHAMKVNVTHVGSAVYLKPNPGHGQGSGWRQRRHAP